MPLASSIVYQAILPRLVNILVFSQFFDLFQSLNVKSLKHAMNTSMRSLFGQVSVKYFGHVFFCDVFIVGAVLPG